MTLSSRSIEKGVKEVKSHRRVTEESPIGKGEATDGADRGLGGWCKGCAAERGLGRRPLLLRQAVESGPSWSRSIPTQYLL